MMRQVKVLSRSQLEDHEWPTQFELGGREVEIVELLDHWPSQDHHYYKVRSTDSCVYILRHDRNRSIWEMTMFERRGEGEDDEPQPFQHNFRGKV